VDESACSGRDCHGTVAGRRSRVALSAGAAAAATSWHPQGRDREDGNQSEQAAVQGSLAIPYRCRQPKQARKEQSVKESLPRPRFSAPIILRAQCKTVDAVIPKEHNLGIDFCLFTVITRVHWLSREELCACRIEIGLLKVDDVSAYVPEELEATANCRADDSDLYRSLVTHYSYARG